MAHKKKRTAATLAATASLVLGGFGAYGLTNIQSGQTNHPTLSSSTASQTPEKLLQVAEIDCSNIEASDFTISDEIVIKNQKGFGSQKVLMRIQKNISRILRSMK